MSFGTYGKEMERKWEKVCEVLTCRYDRHVVSHALCNSLFFRGRLRCHVFVLLIASDPRKAGEHEEKRAKCRLLTTAVTTTGLS